MSEHSGTELRCPCCGSADLPVSYRRIYVSGIRRCRKCVRCGTFTYTMQPHEKVQSINRLYSGELSETPLATSDSPPKMASAEIQDVIQQDN